jgi:hypothetical protein
MAHRQHGRLPWAQLMQPAIVLAEGGFQVSARLHTLLRNDAHLKKDPVAAAYFYRPDGEPRAVGPVLRNPELAVVLRRIATEGARALHEGEIAQAVVTKVRQHPTNPGTMTLADLSAYQPLKRVPLCHDWRASGRDWRVCGFPPPSSGALAIGQILGILQHTPAASLPLQDGLPSADWLHFYSEAARLASLDPSIAAIASDIAARAWGLQVLAAGIQDDSQNRTRFLAIGQLAILPSGRDKTSLILAVANRAGAVYEMLAPLSANGVSMTRFESRPARTGQWEYYFYVDLEGHCDDAPVQKALATLEQQCAFYKLLGSYPAQ